MAKPRPRACVPRADGPFLCLCLTVSVSYVFKALAGLPVCTGESQKWTRGSGRLPEERGTVLRIWCCAPLAGTLMSQGQRGPPAPGLCALEPTGPAGPYTCGGPHPDGPRASVSPRSAPRPRPPPRVVAARCRSRRASCASGCPTPRTSWRSWRPSSTPRATTWRSNCGGRRRSWRR